MTNVSVPNVSYDKTHIDKTITKIMYETQIPPGLLLPIHKTITALSSLLSTCFKFASYDERDQTKGGVTFEEEQ